MKYEVWKGITIIVAGVIVDVLLQCHFGRGNGLAGAPTAISIFIAWGWATA